MTSEREQETRESLVEREWATNPRAMYEAHRENWRTEIATLTAQLQAAQAVISQALELDDTNQPRNMINHVLSRYLSTNADTSALAERDGQVADSAWKLGYDACVQGKQRHSPFGNRDTKGTQNVTE